MYALDNKIPVAGLVALALLLTAGTAFAQADFSRYVSLGDSLAAGFQSGSLHTDAQDTSYPALIHRQAGAGGSFEQPRVSAPGIPSILQLNSLRPLIIAPAPGQGVPLNLTLQRPYDNLAVPGADVNDIVSTVTDNGGLHDLILRGLGTQAQQAVFLQPTFVSLWIGNNDVLTAATSGIVIDGATLTRAADFERNYRTLAATLGVTGANVVAANLPSVTSIPFVTTIPPILVDPATNQPVVINGAFVPLIGPDGPLQLGRDFVLLTASAELAQGKGIPPALGGTGPLSDNVVLSGAEVATIEARVAALNGIIATVAQENGWALVDINTIFGNVAARGLEIGGVELATDFLTGGLFSYDGVHATPLGYAIVANAFIDAINAQFGTSVAPVNLAAFMFGSDGQASGSAAAATGSSFVFSRKAYKNLRFALDIPGPRKLRRMKRQAEASGATAEAAATAGRTVTSTKRARADQRVAQTTRTQRRR